MKALEMLKQNRSTKERAEKYVESINRNIKRDVIDQLIAKKEGLEDKIFELTNFTLDTNLNAGMRQMTKEDCEKRFKEVINLEFELKLLEVELKAKQESFDKYFKD